MSRMIVITGHQTCENLETKQTCSVVYTSDSWQAPVSGVLSEVAEVSALGASCAACAP